MAALAIQIRVRMPRFWLEATLQFQYLRPGLHERDILCAGNDPEPAVPDPQSVDDKMPSYQFMTSRNSKAWT